MGSITVLSGRASADEEGAKPQPTPNCKSFAECYPLALRLYKADQLAEALPAFQAAYAFNAEPNLLINIGRTYFRLGHPREALDYYQRFLGARPNPEPAVRARIEQYITEARQAAEAPAAAAPSSAGAGAPAPDSAAAKPAPDAAAPQSTTASAPPAAAGPDSSAPATAAASATAIIVTPPAVLPVDSRPQRRPVYKRWWFWTIMGLAVAGGITAGVVAATSSTSSDSMSGLDVRKLQF